MKAAAEAEAKAAAEAEAKAAAEAKAKAEAEAEPDGTTSDSESDEDPATERMRRFADTNSSEAEPDGTTSDSKSDEDPATELMRRFTDTKTSPYENLGKTVFSVARLALKIWNQRERNKKLNERSLELDKSGKRSVQINVDNMYADALEAIKQLEPLPSSYFVDMATSSLKKMIASTAYVEHMFVNNIYRRPILIEIWRECDDKECDDKDSRLSVVFENSMTLHGSHMWSTIYNTQMLTTVPPHTINQDMYNMARLSNVPFLEEITLLSSTRDRDYDVSVDAQAEVAVSDVMTLELMTRFADNDRMGTSRGDVMILFNSEMLVRHMILDAVSCIRDIAEFVLTLQDDDIFFSCIRGAFVARLLLRHSSCWNHLRATHGEWYKPVIRRLTLEQKYVCDLIDLINHSPNVSWSLEDTPCKSAISTVEDWDRSKSELSLFRSHVQRLVGDANVRLIELPFPSILSCNFSGRQPGGVPTIVQRFEALNDMRLRLTILLAHDSESVSEVLRFVRPAFSSSMFREFKSTKRMSGDDRWLLAINRSSSSGLRRTFSSRRIPISKFAHLSIRHRAMSQDEIFDDLLSMMSCSMADNISPCVSEKECLFYVPYGDPLRSLHIDRCVNAMFGERPLHIPSLERIVLNLIQNKTRYGSRVKVVGKLRVSAELLIAQHPLVVVRHECTIEYQLSTLANHTQYTSSDCSAQTTLDDVVEISRHLIFCTDRLRVASLLGMLSGYDVVAIAQPMNSPDSFWPVAVTLAIGLCALEMEDFDLNRVFLDVALDDSTKSIFGLIRSICSDLIASAHLIVPLNEMAFCIVRRILAGC